MRWTLGKRLFTVLTITSLVVVGLNAIATRWNFQRGFTDYLAQQESGRLIAMAERLAQLYRRNDNWDLLLTNPRLWDELFRDPNGPDRPPRRRMPDGIRQPPPHDGPPPPLPDPLALRSRVALQDADGVLIIGRISGRTGNADVRQRVGIVESGELLGTLLVRPPGELTGQLDVQFARDQTRSTIYIGAAMLVLAALIAAIVSRQLGRPIAALTKGTRALTAGALDKRITVVRNDELGDLARDFNALADTLRRNQQSRRQWVSDIAHELRTPLAILSGELQAIEDGVRTFDDGTRQSLQAEVDRLGRLVNDLHELTLTDEGQPNYRQDTVNVAVILQQTLAASQARAGDAGLTLRMCGDASKQYVIGDASRLDQMFTNLIENSIRYTDKPGKIEARISATNQHIDIDVSDSAPDVAAHQYELLFDRLYRVDRSRSRVTGGSGLGLSIAAAIVAAHGGEITAGPSDLGGVSVKVRLPRIDPPENVDA